MTGYITTKTGKVPVKCYPVTIPGFEEYSFIAHRTYHDWTRFDREHFPEPFFSKDRWEISETMTGFSVFPSSYSGSMSNKTRTGAIAIVQEYLERNRERFTTAIELYRQGGKP